MKRNKRARKPKAPKKEVDGFLITKLANYLNLAVLVRILYCDYGYRQKRIDKFMESYCALMCEISDGRNTVQGMIKDCLDLTGVNVIDELEKVWEERKKKNEQIIK